MIRFDPRAATLLFFALLAPVYFGLFPYIDVIANPNENTRTYATMALVEDHTFHIDKKMEEFGRLADVALVPDAGGGSHYELVKGPANTYAGVPVYWAMRKLAPLFGVVVPEEGAPHEERVRWLRSVTFVLRLFTVQLPCFLFLIWAERWLRSTTKDVVLRLAAVLALGCGTNYLAYSLMFASHALVGATSFLAYGLTLDQWRKHRSARFRSPAIALVVGLAVGCPAALEYQALVVAVPLTLLAIGVFHRPRAFAALVTGGAIDVVAVMLYQWRAFGNPWTPGHHMVAKPEQAYEMSLGFFGIDYPQWRPLLHVLFSNAFGFFGTSPSMWLGLAAIPLTVFFAHGSAPTRRRQRIGTITWALGCAALFLAISGKLNWRGGWTIGPRYFGAANPFFALGAVPALEGIARRSSRHRAAIRSIACGLALASVLQTGLISIVHNTIDETITRPLPEVALPFLYSGFVPHHVFELVGWSGTAPYFVILASFLVVALLPVAIASDERWTTWTLRGVASFALAYVALFPAFSVPDRKEGDHALEATAWLADRWEPAGRDRITRLREAAERTDAPCDWARLARFDALVGRSEEAERDIARARGAESCEEPGLVESFIEQELVTVTTRRAVR